MAKSNSYKKFIATSATATLVATAVAPAGLAAEKFPDVKKDTPYYEPIHALAEMGVIEGYTDGTFKIRDKVTRAEASRMLSVIRGFKATKEAKFPDVKQDVWYSDGINALYSQGLIDGYPDGTFKPNEQMSRAQFARLVVEAYELPIVEDVKLPFTDVKEDVWYTKYIKTLYHYGFIKGIDEKTFAPNASIDRGDFAILLHKVETNYRDIVEPVDPDIDPKVEDVSAINAKQVKVEFSQPFGLNGTETDSYLVRDTTTGAANDVKAVTKVDEKTVILTLTDAYRVSTDVAVTVDNVYVAGSIKDKFPKFSTVVNVHDTVAPEIVSVTANTTSTNAAEEVIVTFSEPIKANEATFRINNKTVTATELGNTETVYKISNQNLAVGKSHELEVLNVEDYAENKVASLTKTFAVEKDNEAAKGQVTPMSDNKILVKFDKPIVKTSLDNVKFFTFDATTGGFTTSTPATVEQYDKAGKEWLFTLTSANTFYNANKKTEEILVRANKGVIDTSGNLTTPFETKLTLTQDVTGPSLQEVDVEKNSKGEVTKLYFTYDELLAANDDGLLTKIGAGPNVAVADVNNYFTLVNNENNKEVSFTDIFDTPKSIKLASDGRTVIIEVDSAAKAVTSGNYKVTSEKGFVTDTAATPNESQEVTKVLNIGKAEKVVKATPSVANGTNDITVDFDQEVTAESAKNPANYKIDGKALPADTKIVVESPKQVKFTLPDGFIQKDTVAAKITISNIKPVDSTYKFENYVGTIDVLDNTAPVAIGSLLKTGEIFITFSENVANLTTDDFAKVKINGLELNSNVFNVDEATTAEGDAAIKITVDAAVEVALNGFSYLYIDVDNDNELDFDKDIVLAKVSGDTAPDAWYSDGATKTTLKPADLNKVDSVVVVTADPTSTTDKSTLQNKLEAGATITIK